MVATRRQRAFVVGTISAQNPCSRFRAISSRSSVDWVKCLLNQAQNCLIDALECVDVLDLGEFQTIFSYTERLLDLPGPGGITLL